MNSKELVGARIKELRSLKGVRQDILAERLGIEARQLSKLENGKHYPSFETIIRLLDEFEITFEEFLNTGHLQQRELVEKDLIKKIRFLNDERLRLVYKFVRIL